VEGPKVAKALAVLPFENLGDSADAYFADGIANAVRTKLSQIGGVVVIARSSSNEYRRTTKPVQQIARELGVDYLLTATVQWEKAGGVSRVRVTPELVDVASGRAPTARWGQEFDATMAGLFQVQADIAGRVAQALDVELSDSARRQLAERPTRSLAAYDAYLKGDELAYSLGASNPTTLRQALAYYAQAVALDSGFVQAWAQLSAGHSSLYLLSTPTSADADAARRAAERALALAPNRVEGHLAMSAYYRRVAKDQTRALEELARGEKFAPHDIRLLTGSALIEVNLGRWDAALAHLRRAQTLDPRSGPTAVALTRLLVQLRRYAEAREVGDRVLALVPTSLAGIQNRAMVPLAQGDLGGARMVLAGAPKAVEPAALAAYMATYADLYWVLDEAGQRLLLTLRPSAFDDDRGIWGLVLAQTYWLRNERSEARAYADSARLAKQALLRDSPQNAELRVLYGLALAYLGRKSEAEREGRRAQASLPIGKDPFDGAYIQHQLARIYLLNGEPEKALDQLEPLLKVPYILSPGLLKIDPNFESLRGNPRFERLVSGSAVQP
jgi:TolB-like protein